MSMNHWEIFVFPYLDVGCGGHTEVEFHIQTVHTSSSRCCQIVTANNSLELQFLNNLPTL